MIEGDEKRDFICNLESVVNNLKFKIRKRSAVSLLLRRPRFIKSLSRWAISNQASKHFKHVYKNGRSEMQILPRRWILNLRNFETRCLHFYRECIRVPSLKSGEENCRRGWKNWFRKNIEIFLLLSRLLFLRECGIYYAIRFDESRHW